MITEPVMHTAQVTVCSTMNISGVCDSCFLM